MYPEYTLYICENFYPEAKRALDTSRFQSIHVEKIPASCCHPGECQNFQITLNPERKNSPCLVFSSDMCRYGTTITNPEIGIVHHVQARRCVDMLLNGSLIDMYIQEGAYVITAGWLADWSQHMETWGFNQKLAREFFGECIKKVVALDTGVLPETLQRLKEFQEFINLPCTLIPVGLDHFQLYLVQGIQDILLEVTRQNSATAIAEANKSAADYVMMLDFIGSLAQHQTEEKTIDEILTIFTSLFSPGKMSFAEIHEGIATTVHTRASSVVEMPEPGNIVIEDEYSLLDSGTGFRIKIDYLGETLGVLEVDDFAFPDKLEHYLNIALNIARVCGLAIKNARNYSRINIALEQLNESLKLKDEIELELRQKNQELDDFAFMVSHDLKAPLINISGYIQLAKEDPEMISETLEQVEHHTERLFNMIDSVLKYSRAGRIIGHKEKIDLNYLIEEVRSYLTLSQESFTLSIVKPLPEIMGDPEKIEQVLANLINNAIIHRDPGKSQCCIEFDHELSIDHILISIQDNGSGIEPACLEKIFAPSFTTHRYRGSGFGLAIARKIIEAHGGKIWAESRGKGMGATFFIRLPSP